MDIVKGAALAAGLLVAAPVAAQGTTGVAAATVATQPAELSEDAPPTPIKGVAATYRTPMRDAKGMYVTPNRELSAAETTWHLRVALNVAALGCRDADERSTVAAYNALLAARRAQLAAASTAMERVYQVKHAAKWRAAHDDAMTRLYNFFAQTPAHDEFCAEAKAVLAQAATAGAEDLPTVAAAALPRLEAPFLAFYARFDAYQEEYAGWQARHVVKVVVANAAPAVAIIDTPIAVVASAK